MIKYIYVYELYGQRIKAFILVLESSLGKNTGCSSREPKFDPQHPHGSSQASIFLVLGNLMPPSGLLGHQTHIYTYRENIHTHKRTKSSFFKE